MTFKELLLEIGTDEIPSRFLPNVMALLETVAAEEFAKARLRYSRIVVMSTPRRIALRVTEVADKQEDLETSMKGPLWSSAFDSNGVPTKAAIGFAKSKGVSCEDLQQKEVEGVIYACAVRSEAGRQSKDVLPEILPVLIKRLVFPKNMYWEDPAIRFARPIRWLLALLDDAVVPFEIAGSRSDRITRGHRFMGASRIEISKASEYLDKLYDNYVIVDQEKRKQRMLSGIANLERELGETVELEPDLVLENLSLVEYPVPFYGKFDESYLKIPHEVLTTTMKKHQKYFPVRDTNGRLQPFFVGVSNNRAASMDVVREGNERVLRARLSDAAFFWREDLKRSLAGRVEELKHIIHHEKLGSVYDKVKKTQELARWITTDLQRPELLPLVDRAAFLSKADLVTEMVYEFPELQGVMGREYALRDKEPEPVAQAIYEQYLPKFAGDTIPKGLPGAILGLAERIQIIVSCHGIGLVPTGSQDPYALRRAARCINEILFGQSIDLDLRSCVTEAARINGFDDAVRDMVLFFLQQRLLMQLKERGASHEISSLAVSVIGNRPLQALRFLNALSEVQGQSWFSSLISSAVRVRNILAKESSQMVESAVLPSLFRKDAEENLYKEIEAMEPRLEKSLALFDWKAVTELLAELSPAVEHFFEEVLVMDKEEDVRNNRLLLLDRCHRLFVMVGDISVLKGEK